MNIVEYISELLRKVESDVGTRDLNRLVIKSLKDSIRRFQPKNQEDFFHQLHDLVDVIKNTKPRFALIIEHFYAIWQALESLPEEKKKDAQACKRAMLEALSNLAAKSKRENEALIKNAMKVIKDGDTILIHNLSHTVMDVLKMAKKRNKRFKVIVAQQEIEKTSAIIETLFKKQIPFQVVPEYMLSHIEDMVSKVFLGGLTMNNKYNFVVDAGTMSVVSEFHLAKKPIYIFVTTSKFSYWDAREAHHTYKVVSKRLHAHKAITFEHVKFSHDRVPLSFFANVITEEGIFTPEKIKAMYDKEYANREEWRQKFFQDPA